MVVYRIKNVITLKGVKQCDRYFIYALLLLNLFNLTSNLQESIGIPSIFKYAIVFLVLFGILNKFFSKGFENQYKNLFGIILIIFISRTVFLLLFSIEISANFIQKLFVHQLFFLPYFLPIFVLLSSFNLYFFKYLFQISFFCTIVSLCLNIILIVVGINPDFNLIEITIMALPLIAGGMLLMVSHLYKKTAIFKVVLLNTIFLIVILSLLGRRGGILQYGYILILFMLIRYRSNLIKSVKKPIYIVLPLIIFGLIYILLPYLEANVYVFQRGINAEGWDESRGDVIKAFFEDFTSSSDFLFGRGLDGTILRSVKSDVERSSIIENGYLTLLLKGGLLYLVPMLLLLTKATYLGFFKTKNDLTKALASTILIHLISMFSFGIPEASSEYILVWVCVSACFSSQLRTMSNRNITYQLNR